MRVPAIAKITDHQDNLISFQEIDAVARNYMQNALAPLTLKGYRVDWAIFSRWCERSELQALPASADTLIRFITFDATRGTRPSTIVKRLAAIRMAHESSNHRTPTDNHAVRTVLKGIRRDKGTAKRQKSPATAERIESMIAHCPDTLIGSRDKAILLLGFAGAFRRSELAELRVEDIEKTPDGIRVTIRKSKTDQEGKGQTIAILNGSRFRVVDVLMKYMNDAGVKDGYVFRQIHNGNRVPPDKIYPSKVAKIVKIYAGLAGLTVDDFSGHSLRAGFITSSANNGANLFKIMEVSRHKTTDTVMQYIREAQLFEGHAGEKFL